MNARAAAVLLVLLAPVTKVSAQAPLRSPKEFFGFEMGTDRKLANWPEIVEYCRLIGKSSDRVRFAELGKTTLGKPFIALTVSSPENLKALDGHLKGQQ